MHLFIYGTLQDGELREALLGQQDATNRTCPARARDMQAVFYLSHPYPALIVRPGWSAHGQLLLAVSADELRILDHFEGNDYRRSAIHVETASGSVDAMFYQPVIALEAGVPWSFSTWQRQHRPRVIDAEIAQARIARATVLGSED